MMPSILTTRSGIRYGFQQAPASGNNGTADMVHLRLVVRVGSLLERDDQRGAAHFIEHLGFRGTRRFDHGELVSRIESFGSSFGADLNARTSLCETIWQLDLPASALDDGLQILNEWAFWIRISPADVEAERKVILEEWRQKQTPAQRAKQRFWEVAAPIVSTRMPIGTVEFISTTNAMQLREFYESVYRCSSMAVVCVVEESPSSARSIDAQKFSEAIERAFAVENCPRGLFEQQRKTLQFPASLKALRLHSQSSVEYTCVVDPDLQHAAITLEILTNGDSRPTPTTAFLRKDMIKRLVSSMLDERFREKRLCSSVSTNCSVAFSVALQHPYVELSSIRTELPSFNPCTRDCSDALFTLVHELSSCARLGFAQGEMDHAKMKWRRQVTERILTSGAACDELVEHFSLVEQTPVFGFQEEKHLILKMLEDGTKRKGADAIALAEVNSFCASWLRPLVNPSKSPDLLMCIFQGSSLPDAFGEKEMQAVVQSALNAPVKHDDLDRYNFSFDEGRLRNAVQPQRLYPQQPTSPTKRVRNIAETSEDSAPHHRTGFPLVHSLVQLPNSDAKVHVFKDTQTGKEIRICVKQTTSKQISLQAFALGGASELLDPCDDVAFCLAGDVVRESGLLSLTGSELARLEASTGTRVFLQRHLHHRGIGGSCPVNELGLLLDMVVARLKHSPVISETVLERLKHREKHSIEASVARSAASSAGTDETTVIREMAFGDEEPLLKPHCLEHVNELTTKRVEDIVVKAFGSPEEFTFCLIGGINEDGPEDLLVEFAQKLLAVEEYHTAMDHSSTKPKDVTWCMEPSKIRTMNLKFRPTNDRINIINVGKAVTDKAQVFLILKPDDCHLQDIPKVDFLLNGVSEAIRSRLLSRLRTDRGEVYSVSCDFSRVALSPFSRLFVSFSCAMFKDESIVERVKRELEEMVLFGFTEQETSNVLTTLRTRQERASTDSHLLFRLMDGLKMAQGDYKLADEVASQRLLNVYLEDEVLFGTALKGTLKGAVLNGVAALIIRYCPLEKL